MLKLLAATIYGFGDESKYLSAFFSMFLAFAGASFKAFLARLFLPFGIEASRTSDTLHRAGERGIRISFAFLDGDSAIFIGSGLTEPACTYQKLPPLGTITCVVLY